MESENTEVLMIVDVLIQDEQGRRMIEVEGIPTPVPQLFLTPWMPVEDYPRAFAITHVPTGRCVSRGPMPMANALKYVAEIAGAMDWGLPLHEFGEEQYPQLVRIKA